MGRRSSGAQAALLGVVILPAISALLLILAVPAVLLEATVARERRSGHGSLR